VWGVGVWVVAHNPQPPIPNPQSPIPNIFGFTELLLILIFYIILKL